VRETSRDKLAALYEYWGASEQPRNRCSAIWAASEASLTPSAVRDLKGRIDHFFHLAAIYDLEADAESRWRQHRTAHATRWRWPNELKVRLPASLFVDRRGRAVRRCVREDMFDEAKTSTTPYFKPNTIRKDRRQESKVPWRAIARAWCRRQRDRLNGQGRRTVLLLQGDPSDAANAAAVDAHDRHRRRRINIVPVDFVVNAMDHIAHLPNLDGRAFHLIDPEPHRVGDVLNIIARAAMRR